MEETMILTLLHNQTGRDFILGDLHGSASMLHTLLNKVHFDATTDRLIAVGDLFDRGPSPEDCLYLLDQPWFHSVRGNHEQYLLIWKNADSTAAKKASQLQILNAGGEWFFSLPEDKQEQLCKKIAALPVAVLLFSREQRFCVLHAEVAQEYNSIDDFLQALLHNEPPALERCLTGRGRHRTADQRLIENIDWVICGHTPVLPARRIRGNCINLDFGINPLHPKSALGLYQVETDTLWLCNQQSEVSRYDGN